MAIPGLNEQQSQMVQQKYGALFDEPGENRDHLLAKIIPGIKNGTGVPFEIEMAAQNANRVKAGLAPIDTAFVNEGGIGQVNVPVAGDGDFAGTLAAASGAQLPGAGEDPFAPPVFESLLIQGGGPLDRPSIDGPLGPSLPGNLTADFNFSDENLNKLSDFAHSDDPSVWLQLQKENIEAEKIASRDALKRQRLGSLAEAKGNLAAAGGLRSGATERLELGGIRTGQLQEQLLGREAGRQFRTSELAEQENKLDLQKFLPQFDLQRSQAANQTQQFNISNILKQSELERQQKLEAYRIKAGIEAAKQQSQATIEAADKDRFLGIF